MTCYAYDEELGICLLFGNDCDQDLDCHHETLKEYLEYLENEKIQNNELIKEGK